MTAASKESKFVSFKDLHDTNNRHNNSPQNGKRSKKAGESISTPKTNFTFLNNFKIQPFSHRPDISKKGKQTVSISTSAMKDFEVPPDSAPKIKVDADTSPGVGPAQTWFRPNYGTNDSIPSGSLGGTMRI